LAVVPASEILKSWGSVRGVLRRRWPARAAGALALLCVAAAAPAMDIHDGYFRTSDGIRLHYRQSGHGDKTLVFIPGWLMPADIFDGQLARLGDRYRVYALSPRSQGGSDLYVGRHSADLRARDIEEFVGHLDAPDFVLVGWSLGVMEGLDYVHRYHPPGLRAMVLIDNSIGEASPPVVTAAKVPSRPPTPAERIQHLRDFVRGMFRTPQPPAFLARLDRSAQRPSAEVARQLLAKPYPREYYKDSIYQENVPVWYAITPRFREQGAALVAHLPSARMTIYPEAGHALFVDAAAQFNDDLQHFLEDVY